MLGVAGGTPKATKVNKANGATALATQHNNPDNKRPKVQNMLKGKEDTKLDEFEKFLPLLAAIGRGVMGAGRAAGKVGEVTGALGGDDEESD